MIVEIQFWKGQDQVFACSFAVSDKSQMPDNFRKATAAFYEAAPDLSLLDPEMSIKVDAPKNKDTPVYAEKAQGSDAS